MSKKTLSKSKHADLLKHFVDRMVVANLSDNTIRTYSSFLSQYFLLKVHINQVKFNND